MAPRPSGRGGRLTGSPEAPALSGTRARVLAAAAGKIAEWGSLAAMLVVIPRILGPADYGVFGIALGLVTLGSAAFALGGPTLMARFVAGAASHERAALVRALALRGALWRAAGLALLAAVVVALVRIDPIRFPPRPTFLILAAIVFDAGATLCFQIALGLDRALVWSFRYPAQNLFLLVAVPLLYRQAGVAGALAAIALSTAGALAVGAGIVRGHLTGERLTIPREVSRFALLQGLVGLTVQILFRGGVVAVALLAGSGVETGYSAVAMGITAAASYGVWQLFVVTLPPLAQVAATDGPAADVMLSRLTTRLVLVVVPASLLGTVLAAPVLNLLAGHRFAPAGRALAWALAAVPLAPITGAIGSAAAVRLEPASRLRATAAGAVTFLLLAAGLVPRLGAAGASAAFLAGTTVTAVSGAVFFPGLVSRGLLVVALGAAVIGFVMGVIS